MKLRPMAALLATTFFFAGAVSAQDMASDKGKLSYALGYQVGQDIGQTGEQIDFATFSKAVQDAYAKRPPAIPVDQLKAVYEAMQQRQMARAKAQFDKMATENQQKSSTFLATNKAKPGVVTLPSGVQYRIVEPGTGAKPTLSSTVTLDYKGIIPNGPNGPVTFVDTSATRDGKAAEPVSIKLSEIPLVGLREVLVMMPTGSRWEVTLPPAKAYGNNPQSQFPPNQVVVYDLRLVGVK
jgi:FKBP-type peptidyl-prolyl cis-trans isomerase